MTRMKSWLIVASLLGAGVALPAATPGDKPLPSMEDILQRVVERGAKEMENDRLFDAHYGFTFQRTTDTKNTKGELKKTEERVLKHDPSTAAAAKKKSEPVVTEASLKADAEAKGRAFEKRDFVLNTDIIRRFTFNVVGRETIEGRPAVVLEFVPAGRNLPVKTFKDKFINKAAGRVWIDEADAVVVKVDMRLTEEVSVVGGLVGNVKRCVYGFLRARTPEGWWFTQNVRWQMEGRQFFTHKIMECHEQKKDVKRVM